MVINLIKLLRPHQWVKNLLVFVPIIFARELLSPQKLESAGYAFVSFSLIASAGYIFNDILDKKQDAQHPQKKNRPIASEKISKKTAGGVLAIVSILGVLVTTFLLPPKFWLVVVVYAVFNAGYSLYLKHLPILDILLVTSFYLLRVLAGGVATDTFISEWLVLVMASGALLLITGKRVSERRHPHPRAVSKNYSRDLLKQILTLATALTIITYSLYTVLGAHTNLAIYSTVFVVYGVLRYLQVLENRPALAEYPEKVFIKDKGLLAAVIGWSVYMMMVLYRL